VAEAGSPAALAVFLALWLPMDLHELRVRRRETLANAVEVRTWMNGVRAFAASGEKVDGFVYAGTPGGWHSWGVEGALKYFYERNDLVVKPEGQAVAGRVARLVWDPWRKRLDISVRTP
jgi:hypothetical protein